MHVVRSKRSLPPQGRQLRRVRRERGLAVSTPRVVGHEGHGSAPARALSTARQTPRIDVSEIPPPGQLDATGRRRYYERNYRRFLPAEHSDTAESEPTRGNGRSFAGVKRFHVVNDRFF